MENVRTSANVKADIDKRVAKIKEDSWFIDALSQLLQDAGVKLVILKGEKRQNKNDDRPHLDYSYWSFDSVYQPEAGPRSLKEIMDVAVGQAEQGGPFPDQVPYALGIVGADGKASEVMEDNTNFRYEVRSAGKSGNAGHEAQVAAAAADELLADPMSNHLMALEKLSYNLLAEQALKADEAQAVIVGKKDDGFKGEVQRKLADILKRTGAKPAVVGATMSAAK